MTEKVLLMDVISCAIFKQRRDHPEDTRSDSELFVTVCETLYKRGLIGKSADGKFALPEYISGPNPFVE